MCDGGLDRASNFCNHTLARRIQSSRALLAHFGRAQRGGIIAEVTAKAPPKATAVWPMEVTTDYECPSIAPTKTLRERRESGTALGPRGRRGNLLAKAFLGFFSVNRPVAKREVLRVSEASRACVRDSPQVSTDGVERWGRDGGREGGAHPAGKHRSPSRRLAGPPHTPCPPHSSTTLPEKPRRLQTLFQVFSAFVFWESLEPK